VADLSPSSWPGKSAKRVFARVRADEAAIHVFARPVREDMDAEPSPRRRGFGPVARDKPAHDE
jgi:hypothetical protein